MHSEPLDINLQNEFHCYMLGYFWADCYFGKDSKNKYRITFEILDSDFTNVKEILHTMGFRKCFARKRKNSSNPQSGVKAYGLNKLLFFKESGYDNKINGCPLYFKLDNEMKKYFIKGFIDGDGTICLSKNNSFRVLCYGDFNQNWDFIEDFCNQNSIPFSIYRKERKANHPSHKEKVHRTSAIEIRTKEGKQKFCELINLDIGLSRKRQIFLDYKLLKPKQIGTAHKKNLCFCGGSKDIRSKKCRRCSYIKCEG